VIDRDITAWVRNELWDQVPVSISVVDQSYRIVEANARFADTYGEWRNRPCHEVYKGLKAPCEDCAAKRTMADGRIRVREEQGLLPSGEIIHYLVHLVPLVREKGDIPFVVEMSTDITDTKRLQQEKLQAERLAAVGETVAGLAHGVKNVLTALDGGMYLARTGIKNGDIQRMLTGWDMLEDSIGRISAFVKEFLDFAKGRAPDLEMTDLNRLVLDVVRLFESAAGLAGIRIEHELDPAIAPLPLDGDGIHNCLSNLVSNALDACKMSEKPGGRVKVKTHEKDGQIHVEVSDDGIGIDAEISKKVFTNFFSTKGSDKGTGLGLLTRHPVERARNRSQ
jgi:PAS domain S-box-containing protein